MHKFVHFHGKPNALGTWNVQLADICKKIPKFLFNLKKICRNLLSQELPLTQPQTINYYFYEKSLVLLKK